MTTFLHKHSQAFSETEIDGEVVVMDLDRGDFFSLTGTAVAIWRKIDGTRSRSILIAELAEEYARPEGEVTQDVDAFLAQLKTAGLIDGC